MPRPGPRMEQVAVRLDAETLAALDAVVASLRLASGQDVTRSNVLRLALTRYLSRRR